MDEEEEDKINIPEHNLDNRLNEEAPGLNIPEDDDFDESKRINSCMSDLLDMNEVDQFRMTRGNSIKSERSEQDSMLMDSKTDKVYYYANGLINEIINNINY